MGPTVLALVVAIVTQNGTPLRAAASRTAARQEMLYAGDWLELRGERQGWLKVYDHRHERPGYVRPADVRSYPDDASSARDLAAVIDFLRDQPGQESLGIGLAALFLRVAPPQAVGPELFDGLGEMARRLGERASSRWAHPGDAQLAGDLEVAESYGVHFRSFERDGRTRVCYDGEAFRRVLALTGASPAARVRAALALTDPACVDPGLAAADRASLLDWQASVLDRVDPTEIGTTTPLWLLGRLRLRRSTVQAELAWERARRGDRKGAAAAAEAATRELAAVDRTELADDDALAYEEAAVRAGSVRFAAAPPPSSSRATKVTFRAGQPGQTCVRIAAGGSPPVEQCTYAVVWPGSVRVAPRGRFVAWAQSPLPGWTELVVLEPGHPAQTLAPAAVDPDLGYVELAGWSPDGTRLLIAREAKVTGPLGQPGTRPPSVDRTFQVLRVGGLTIEKQASRLDRFPTFRRWQSPTWRRTTLALR